MMNKLKIGIIGVGEISSNIHLPVLANIENIVIDYIYDIDQEKSKLFSGILSCRNVVLKDQLDFPQTDLVLIAIPIGVRDRYLQYFYDKNCGVILEKPFAQSKSEAFKLLKTYNSGNLFVCFQRKMYQSCQTVKSIIDSGIFGQLKEIIVEEGARTLKTNTDFRFYDNSNFSSGGILLDLGSHSIDLIFYLTGFSEYDIISSNMILDQHVDRETKLLFRIRKDGKDIIVNGFYSWLKDTPNRMTFIFDNASLEISSKPSDIITIANHNNIATFSISLMKQHYAKSVYQSFYLFWNDVINNYSVKRNSLFSADSSLVVVSLIEESYNIAKCIK